MVTKREIAAAQQALNDAVGQLDQFLRYGTYFTTPIEAMNVVSMTYQTWDRLRQTLEGEGPAVARATSIAAAKERLMRKQSVRRDILVMVVAHHNHYGCGMTTDAIQARLHGSHQTISARVSELVNTYQLLRDSGRKYVTRTGSKAIGWEPTEEARQMVAAVTTGREPG
jgi:hypothetical protein